MACERELKRIVGAWGKDVRRLNVEEDTSSRRRSEGIMYLQTSLIRACNHDRYTAGSVSERRREEP